LLDAGQELNVPLQARPPLLSTANASWYFWALANGVLFTPLLAFVAIGVVTTGSRRSAVAASRRRPSSCSAAWCSRTPRSPP
jgi:hypothetical protein